MKPARSLVVLFALAALGRGEARAAPAPALALGAGLDCREELGTGRLLCTVEISPPFGYSIAWSDALVVEAPPAARPLRSRVPGAGDPPRSIVLGFVLASGEGGSIEIVARAAVCPAPPRAGACRPLSIRLAAPVASR